METQKPLRRRVLAKKTLLVCVALVALSACGSSTKHTVYGSTSPNGTTSSKANASSSGNASSDATITQCSTDQIDYVAASGTLKNTSSQPSSFSITVAYVAPDGTQLETGTTGTPVVAPGQTGTWETSSVPTRYVAGTICKVSAVTRTATAS